MRPMTLPLPMVSRVLKPVFRVILNPRLPVPVQRTLLEVAARSLPLPEGTVIRSETVGGVPVERVTVGATVRRTAVLYLHGGAYTLGSPLTHRVVTSSLARDTGAVVVAAHYRLAPEHPCPAALEDALAVFDGLVADGVAADHIAVVGDSAGGGLAAATTQALVDRGTPPSCVAMISPWADPADQDFPAPRDFLLDARWLRNSARQYLGDGDPTDPRYAPVRGTLTGFPSTLIQYSADEILRPQILRFVDALTEAGVSVRCTELTDLWHVAHLQATLLAEAATAVREIGAFVRDATAHSERLRP
ncbi:MULTISPECIES: alpha/beta hydrolase [unclassified Rhodococcus (in: high G+C Gram-positive bacteria)]|uniref:alpha/beta hydrolase n=1 Tax=unclassified Rhodococcus (in: high G+C Gram-positive bacteria) TaxID=192944 RepID=UPI0006F2279A|nr:MULTISPECIES: alpha/beta hydrolase [unclassified Rhodococcus (in: high G+C Gram-positive bacteria)]KQU35617.1 esterase [Rhodococcus sp. Leaf225]KQU48015.1 esterase [Rhodococcus sp. Leaf258]